MLTVLSVILTTRVLILAIISTRTCIAVRIEIVMTLSTPFFSPVPLAPSPGYY